MKRWLTIPITLVVLALLGADMFWWIPFHELSKGQLAIIGEKGSDRRNIYLLDPLHRSWQRLPTDDLVPWRIAWSPGGKEIAFTYATGKNEPYDTVGVAILKLENMETEKVYVAPANESTGAVTWTADGQSLVFDVGDRTHETAVLKLELQTGKIQSIPFPENLLPQYFSVDHLEIAQNNDYVMGSGSGTYIVAPDLKNIHQISDDMDGFALMPDRKEVTLLGGPATLLNYNTDTNQLKESYHGNFPDYGFAEIGDYSYDGRDLVYLMGGGGEGDPQYIMLLDTWSKHNYVMYKYDYPERIGSVLVWQLAWHSVK